GRAYELEYVKKDTTDVMLRAIDPANAFVVYDTDIEQHSLFAVRYYLVDYMGKKEYHIEVYTDESVYYFRAADNPSTDITFEEKTEHFFESVPLTEFINNSERMGDWEAAMDKIDAVDKSLSEMANSQEDFSNAMMHIDGDFNLADEKGDEIDGDSSNRPAINTQARIIFTKPSILNDGLSGNTTVVPSTVDYLTKDTNVPDWKVYVDLLSAQIHKDTNTPDTSDQNFAGNVSGEAMSYKLWGQDQARATQQSLFTRGIMRRLRLL
ncbi:phage portal protein, partial [Lactobacillus sp. XV13L]|nr:phage portal protein [Lactobacillus sp. XV13L]